MDNQVELMQDKEKLNESEDEYAYVERYERKQTI